MKKRTGILTLCFACILLAACKTEMTQQQSETYIDAKKQYLAGNLAGSLETLRTDKFGTRRGHQGKLLEAKILFLQGQAAESEKILLRLLDKNPRYTEAQLWLARSQLANEKISEAQETIEKAMEYNPEDPRFLSLAGNIREIEKDYQQALEYHMRAALYGEDLARTEISLAQLYYRFGQDARATEHIHRAQALVSERSVLRRPLQELEIRMKKKEQQNDQ